MDAYPTLPAVAVVAGYPGDLLACKCLVSEALDGVDLKDTSCVRARLSGLGAGDGVSIRACERAGGGCR
jgi:hypothetical protein